MSRDVQKLFALRLKAIREERKLSQLELALLCDLDRTYIGRIETLQRNPSLVVLEKIANGLEIELHELLNFSE